jgi:membrane associated rhomboid family serine protease
MDNFQDAAAQLAYSITLLKENLPLVLALIAGLYGIQLLNFLLGYRLNILGIYPRNIFGLIGIFFSPLLHGNFNHIFFNSIPLFILMSLTLLSGFTTFLSVTATITLVGGLGTWLFGRKALHIGASGLIMGYWSYLLMNAYQQPTIISLALGLVCIYYLGSLFMNLFPLEAKSSWEAHVFGCLGGLASIYTTPYLNALLTQYGL